MDAYKPGNNMATKKSVFLSDLTTNWIEVTTKKDDFEQGAKWSEAINATFEQLIYLVRSSLPELSVKEWEIILNVYAGCYFPAHGVPARIASDIMDNFGEVDIDDIKPELAAFVRKTHAMSQTEQLAILYVAQMFLSKNWGSYNDFQDIINAIKKAMIPQK
jgi:hypothetical protein